MGKPLVIPHLKQKQNNFLNIYFIQFYWPYIVIILKYMLTISIQAFSKIQVQSWIISVIKIVVKQNVRKNIYVDSIKIHQNVWKTKQKQKTKPGLPDANKQENVTETLYPWKKEKLN